MMAKVADSKSGVVGGVNLQRVESLITEVGTRLEALQRAGGIGSGRECPATCAENIQIAEQITQLIAEREQLEIRVAELAV